MKRKRNRRRSNKRRRNLAGLLGYNRGRRRNRKGRRRNPLVLANRGRRRHRRGRRRNLTTYFSNPFKLGGIVGKVTAPVKGLVAKENVKKGAATAVGAALGWYLPARFLPEHDEGLKGVALTAVTGALASTVVGFAAPAMAPAVLVGAIAATVLKAAYIYGRQYLAAPTFRGLGAFLTLPRSGMGQIPAGLIAGGMGDFLATKQGVTAIGPTRSAALGGERFSAFS